MVVRSLIALALLGAPAAAQQAEPTDAQRAQWAREWEERLHSDWAYLARYRDANAALVPAPGKPRIVFMGDSITEGWVDKVPAFFTPGRVGRGISGQTTPQMLVRFHQDVLALKPRVVHILAGINDVAGNTGPADDRMIEDNVRAMTELAQAHGVRVVLASILPAADFPWRPGLDPGERVVRLNAWIKAYAGRSGAVYADYWSAMHDGVGMRAGLAYDGVHPTEAGYQVMVLVADAAIARALKLKSAGSAARCAAAANPC